MPEASKSGKEKQFSISERKVDAVARQRPGELGFSSERKDGRTNQTPEKETPKGAESKGDAGSQ